MTERVDLEDLFECARPQLVGILRRHSIPLADAEDVLQEAYLCAVRREGNGRRPLERPRHWLAVVLQSKCLAYLARRRRCPVEYAEEAWLEVAAGPQPAPQRGVEQMLFLAELLRPLKPRERLLLWLRLGLALSDGEIAARTGHRPASVRKLVGRALLRARRAAGVVADRRPDTAREPSPRGGPPGPSGDRS